MKYYCLSLTLAVIITSGCDDCGDNDCGGDDAISIRVVGDNEINYSDSIDFYYYDKNQQKIEATIQPNRPGAQIYRAALNYRIPEIQTTYYLEIADQTKTVNIQTRYDEDACCGDYLRFKEITVDGATTALPIEVVVD